MLQIYGRTSSYNVQKVLWLADELSLDYQHIPAGGEHGGLDHPEFLAMNPGGRIPVIVDGTTIIWETHAILRYLAAQYGNDNFQRESPTAQSLIDRWVDWSLSELEPAFFGGIFWGYYRTPDAQRDQAAISRALKRCDQLYQRLDDQLRQQPWLSGETLGLADIPAGTTLYRYFEMDGISRPELPHVRRWYQQLKARTAYQRQIMRPFNELKGRLAY